MCFITIIYDVEMIHFSSYPFGHHVQLSHISKYSLCFLLLFSLLHNSQNKCAYHCNYPVGLPHIFHCLAQTFKIVTRTSINIPSTYASFPLPLNDGTIQPATRHFSLSVLSKLSPWLQSCTSPRTCLALPGHCCHLPTKTAS